MHDDNSTPTPRLLHDSEPPRSSAELDGPASEGADAPPRSGCAGMEAPSREEVAIREQVARGESDAAAAAAIALYGAEIFGFLIGVLDHAGAAHDVYATFSAHLRGHLPRAAWGCSLRVMMYLIACRALADHTRARAPREGAAESAAPREGESIVAPTPVAKSRFDRADSVSGISALRRNLSQGARELLVLRVDRGLAWNDIALISLGESAAPVDVRRESKRLERRFRSIREQLARTAIDLGLLPV